MNRAFLLSLGTLLLWMSTVSALPLENAAFRVSVMGSDDGVLANVEDLAGKRTLADGRYYYHAVREGEKGRAYSLENAAVTAGRGTIVIRGRLAGLEVEQVFSLPPDRPILEERIVLHNGTRWRWR